MELDRGFAGSWSMDAKTVQMWRQMSHEEKIAAIAEKIKELRRLPRTSRYVRHHMNVLYKIRQLLCAQRTTSRDEAMESLFSRLHI